MQITFDTRNPQDLTILEQLFKNIELLKPEQAAQPAPEPASEPQPVAKEEAVAEEKPKRTRKAKEEAKPEPHPEPEVEPETESADVEVEVVATVDPATFTLDEVRAALQQFAADKGVPAGIELLKKFGAGRISELKEDDYASFIAECAL